MSRHKHGKAGRKPEPSGGRNKGAAPPQTPTSRVVRVARVLAAQTLELWKTFPDAAKLSVLTSLAAIGLSLWSLNVTKVESPHPAAATPADEPHPISQRAKPPARALKTTRGTAGVKVEDKLPRAQTRAIVAEQTGSVNGNDDEFRSALTLGRQEQWLGHYGGAYRSLRDAAERLDENSKRKVLGQLKEAKANYERGLSYEATHQMERALSSVNP